MRFSLTVLRFCVFLPYPAPSFLTRRTTMLWCSELGTTPTPFGHALALACTTPCTATTKPWTASSEAWTSIWRASAPSSLACTSSPARSCCRCGVCVPPVVCTVVRPYPGALVYLCPVVDLYLLTHVWFSSLWFSSVTVFALVAVCVSPRLGAVSHVELATQVVCSMSVFAFPFVAAACPLQGHCHRASQRPQVLRQHPPPATGGPAADLGGRCGHR